MCLSWPEAILQSFEHRSVQIFIEFLIVRIRTGFLGNVSYVFSNAPQLINTNAIFTCLCYSLLQIVYSASGVLLARDQDRRLEKRADYWGQLSSP